MYADGGKGVKMSRFEEAKQIYSGYGVDVESELNTLKSLSI